MSEMSITVGNVSSFWQTSLINLSQFPDTDCLDIDQSVVKDDFSTWSILMVKLMSFFWQYSCSLEPIICVHFVFNKLIYIFKTL